MIGLERIKAQQIITLRNIIENRYDRLIQIYKLTPKNGVSILDARSSKDKTTAPVKNIKDKYL